MQTKDNLGSNDSLRHELGGGGFLAAKDHVQTENGCRDFLLAAIVRRLRRVKMWSQKSYIDRYWLVVWNMNFIFSHRIGNFIIPTDEVIFFRGRSTTNQT